jgi:hypothetical protein
MKTIDLINALAAETPSEPRRKLRWRLLPGAIAGGCVAVAIVALFYGVRPHLHVAMTATLLKSSFGLVSALVTFPILLRLCRPNIRVGAAAAMTIVFVFACAVAAITHIVIQRSLAPLGLAYGLPQCLFRVPLLALPIGVILGFLVRSFAPTRLTYAGAAIGAFSAGVAIIPYALFCPVDSVAYVGTWYLGSIVLCAAAGAALGGRVLRWT